MSEHFFTFQGQAMPGGDRLVAVNGVEGGDRIKSVVSVTSPGGDFTSSFAPFVPTGNLIVQDSSDQSGRTFLLIVERDDD